MAPSLDSRASQGPKGTTGACEKISLAFSSGVGENKRVRKTQREKERTAEQRERRRGNWRITVKGAFARIPTAAAVAWARNPSL